MRKIRAYKKYFEDFMSSLSTAERDKVTRALALFKVEDKIPSHYIKFLKDEIYEFRVTCANIEIRLLFIYDGKDIVILFNCFKKKTQKTPNSEINKAIKLKQEYYETKRNTKGPL
ncbi:MAG: type II toxin-antitoxin system RelE/ParE family toxin [Bacteroidales bacterium]|nr:type II toxin-antitoxin system RelE/ParE family toxin [Bacteroidales bacterium]